MRDAYGRSYVMMRDMTCVYEDVGELLACASERKRHLSNAGLGGDDAATEYRDAYNINYVLKHK